MQTTRTTSQFFKFILTGVLNTVLDLAVLNVCIVVFGLNGSTARYLVFKSIAFAAAVVNSYLVNRYWVFQKDRVSRRVIASEMGLFLAVSVIGLSVNALSAAAVFSVGTTATVWPDAVWANIGALVGTCVAFGWNFVGYKLLVFRA